MNCISSPITWGFPSLTAFSGLMVALQRNLGKDAGIQLSEFGVICHKFEPQVDSSRFVNRFNLMRHPLGKAGETRAINEEGRAHAELSLVFKLKYDSEIHIEGSQSIAVRLLEVIQGMRIAGGSIIPAVYRRKLAAFAISADSTDFEVEWKKHRMYLLPGSALVGRTDLLQDELKALRTTDPSATTLDALLNLSRINRAAAEPIDIALEPENGAIPKPKKVEWPVVKRKGWLVPIPVGFKAISQTFAPGTVANSRDPERTFRFVESVYSMGEWIGIHRIKNPSAMTWRIEPRNESNNYLLSSNYKSVV